MTDIDAAVRAEAVKCTVKTAIKDLSAVNEPALQAVRERALDKKVLFKLSTFFLFLCCILVRCTS